MAIRLGPRTVLQVSKTDTGDIEIALKVDAEVEQRLVVRSEDVAVLIDLLQRHVEHDDPEDRSTLRNLRPVS